MGENKDIGCHGCISRREGQRPAGCRIISSGDCAPWHYAPVDGCRQVGTHGPIHDDIHMTSILKHADCRGVNIKHRNAAGERGDGGSSIVDRQGVVSAVRLISGHTRRRTEVGLRRTREPSNDRARSVGHDRMVGGAPVDEAIAIRIGISARTRGIRAIMLAAHDMTQFVGENIGTRGHLGLQHHAIGKACESRGNRRLNIG